MRGTQKSGHINHPPERHESFPLMENCVMSKHHLEFKGWGFSVAATGIVGISAAVLIIALILLVTRGF